MSSFENLTCHLHGFLRPLTGCTPVKKFRGKPVSASSGFLQKARLPIFAADKYFITSPSLTVWKSGIAYPPTAVRF
jgi:hypothetical protein